MKANKQANYGSKMNSIQSKFKFICQNYEKVVEQLHHKNTIIEQLNDKIRYLQDNLRRSNKQVTQLEATLQNREGFNRTASQQYLKARLALPPQIEYQYFQNRSQHQRHAHQAVQSNASIKDQINSTYGRFNHLSPQPHKPSSFQHLKEEVPFSKRLEQLKQKIGTQSSHFSLNHHLKFKDITNSSENSFQQFSTKSELGLNNRMKSEPGLNFKMKEVTKLSKQKENVQSRQDLKTLHKIWQERDSQIYRMDEMFQSINDKLKQYEHQTTI